MFLDPITNEKWAKLFKQRKLNPTDFQNYKVIPKENELTRWKPSDLYQPGEYPFSNYYSNSFVLCFFGNFKMFDSNDRKLIN